MGNVPDPVLIAILSAVMGLLGGLITIPITVMASWMLKNREQENQDKLDLLAKKQDLLLRHRLDLQRQKQADVHIRASIAKIKVGQKQQREDINSLAAANDENIAAIRESLAGLGQNVTSLTNKTAQMDEHLLQLQMEKDKVDEATSQASIARIETRLLGLEELHDGLKRDS
jgi:hypothetical protein